MEDIPGKITQFGTAPVIEGVFDNFRVCPPVDGEGHSVTAAFYCGARDNRGPSSRVVLKRGLSEDEATDLSAKLSTVHPEGYVVAVPLEAPDSVTHHKKQ